MTATGDLDRQALAKLLLWYRDAGVEETVGAFAYDRLKPVAAAPPAISSAPRSHERARSLLPVGREPTATPRP